MAGLLMYSGWGLLAVRVVMGIIFFVHGRNKIAMWKMKPSAQMPSGMLNIMKFLSITETLGGIALFFGFLTQWAALGVGIIMVGAIYFKIFKWGLPFASTEKNGWEFDLILLVCALMLMVSGAGMLSFDAMM